MTDIPQDSQGEQQAPKEAPGYVSLEALFAHASSDRLTGDCEQKPRTVLLEIKRRLQLRRASHEAELDLLKAALDAIERNPEIASVLDLLAKALRGLAR